MNKSELIKAVAAKAELPQAEVAKVLDAALEAAVEAVKNGEGLQLVGYANISVQEKPAHMARDPRSGKAIEVPAKKVVKIKPGAKFAF